jgi:serine/threonine-protein kinase
VEKSTLFGPYELRSRLGRSAVGRIAEVFRAIDTRTGAPCALKRILPLAAEDDAFVDELEDEARIASQLRHPGIARVLDHGAIDGTHFIAYELVDGVDLRFVFENASLASEPPPLALLLHVFLRISDALAYAHERHVVHRDVTPENIVVGPAGDAKLLDFGIAKARGRLSRTGAGILKGKLGYMSPEQARGEAVDARSDLFSLGICMWELLTLKRLFSASNEILVLDMVKHHVPEPPSAHRAEVAPELDRIVLKALAKKHDERYRSARQLTQDLEAFRPSFVGISGALARRDDIARIMTRTFAAGNAQRSTASIMEPQETRMSNENKSGSDLDIFEGLGKKSSGRTSAAPPPPPGSIAPASGSEIAAAPPPSGPVSGPGTSPMIDAKKTLMGIPGPFTPPSASGLPAAPPSNSAMASAVPSAPSVPSVPSSPPAPPSGSFRAAPPSAPPPVASQPPPPPGRGSLPNLESTSSSPTPSQPALAPTSQPPSAMKLPPPPASTRPGPSALASTAPGIGSPGAADSAPAAPKKMNGGKLDMDWDDDNEATHVFDKESRDNVEAAASGPESRPPEHASMDDILSKPRTAQTPAAGTPAPASLSGAFGALGQPQPRESSNGSSPASSAGSGQFRSGPPTAPSLRSAPPPPPGSIRPYNPTSTAPMAPPPPPPGQTTTAPMHMPARPPTTQPPPSGQGSMPPQGHAHGPHGSVPPQQHVSQPPMPQMPPVSRAMEATAVVPRATVSSSSNSGLWVAVLLGVVMAVGAAVFFLMPRTGTLVVNVADAKGSAVSNLEILVDGKKACDSAPCIVRDVASGVHEVKIVAAGYDAPAARAITIESRKDSSTDFTLSAAKSSGGTGLKVSGNPLQTGVRLSVDGKEIGLLPQELHDLTPGEHKIKITGSERYAPVEKTIEIKQDEVVDLGNVALKVLKGKATVQLGTPGAKVYLVSGTNRKEVPQFPIAIDFDPNEKWNLEAKMPGMEDYAQPISFDDGQAEKTIVVTLAPKGSTPAMTAPAAVAKPPVFTAPPAAAPAAAQPAAPAAVKTEPAAPAAAAAPKEPVAKKEPAAAAGEAFLNINSRPASTVLLDGKPLGPTPRVKVSVSPGTHTVLFVNAEESLKKSVSVTVAAGETKAVSAKLRD